MLVPMFNFPVHGGHKLPVKLLSSLLGTAGPQPEHPYPRGCSRLTPHGQKPFFDTWPKFIHD